MKKCLVIPDSFKGTMSAAEVCGIMEESIRRAFPECEVITAPIADGGEGTVDCFLKAFNSGERVSARVTGPFFEEADSFYGVTGDLGIIEMAAAAGLSIAGERADPEITTTYGVGELIGAAIRRGCGRIILGLGGSCTNDGGCGMAAALGAKFYDGSGCSFIPVGGTLERIVDIDVSETKRILNGIEISAICDIDNPLFGKNGAAYVFAPQKGAGPEKVKLLDRNLRCLARAVRQSLNIDVSDMPGGGAAGGMGAGAYAFMGAKLKKGIDAVLDAVRFEEIAYGCDCIFTGEGKLDAQSLSGKAVVGIGRRAKTIGAPVAAVVGSFEGSASEMRGEGISYIFETAVRRSDFEQIKKHCREDLRKTMEDICGKQFLNY